MWASRFEHPNFILTGAGGGRPPWPWSARDGSVCSPHLPRGLRAEGDAAPPGRAPGAAEETSRSRVRTRGMRGRGRPVKHSGDGSTAALLAESKPRSHSQGQTRNALPLFMQMSDRPSVQPPVPSPLWEGRGPSLPALASGHSPPWHGRGVFPLLSGSCWRNLEQV